MGGRQGGRWWHLCLTSALPFLFLQLEGDAVTLKPRPSGDMANSSAPSPSHKVQRSVSANPKQRRFSDQGECFWELPVWRLAPLLRSHMFWGLWLSQLSFAPCSATYQYRGLWQAFPQAV